MNTELFSDDLFLIVELIFARIFNVFIAKTRFIPSITRVDLSNLCAGSSLCNSQSIDSGVLSLLLLVLRRRTGEYLEDYVDFLVKIRILDFDKCEDRESLIIVNLNSFG